MHACMQYEIKVVYDKQHACVTAYVACFDHFSHGAVKLTACDQIDRVQPHGRPAALINLVTL